MYLGTSALEEATENNMPEAVKLLLQYGADTNCMMITKDHALIDAIRKNYTKIVSLLLQYGAEPNARYTPILNKERSSLHLAMNNSNQEIIDLLLSMAQLSIKKIQMKIRLS